MIIKQSVTKEWEVDGYEKVFDVVIPKIEGSINTNQLKADIRYFVIKNVNDKHIEVKPICWQNNKPTIVVNLSDNKFLFIINK